MRVKMGDHIYRPRLVILGETGLIGRGRNNSYHADLCRCQMDGFVGTRKSMVWHIKIEHREYLEMVE